MYGDNGADVTRDLITGLKRVKARLDRAMSGKVKRPDYPGMQSLLDGFLEERIKPVLSDLSHVIDQGTLRVRAEYRRGEHRNKAE